MARKSFTIRTEPHVAEVGDVELLFRPEVDGDEFLDGYVELQDAQKKLGGSEKDLSPEALREATAAVRAFLARWMLPESQQVYATMRLPQRVEASLLEWLMGEEVYGQGRPPTSPSDSSPRPPSPGIRGTGSSRSKASTPARGR
ncbi:hypothetical protein E1211_25905 [Micromonospora sp. 15K316]|uniref:hypothetical protein n=1 Tax=Micromonospora sp. 15K316 TaxID=2530376 RepID=UPI001048FF59|nr:hypothetical protein [Micromonospora sp. 15K316]TDC29496.1 hypothetical protein E1211_25905 [Micromonospora sp. 15K316]